MFVDTSRNGGHNPFHPVRILECHTVPLHDLRSPLVKPALLLLQMMSSTPFRPLSIISLTSADQASITEASFASACFAANSRPNAFAGVVRLPTPFKRLSLTLAGNPANSDVHQSSPNNPTSARLASRSSKPFLTPSASENSSTRGMRRAH